MEAIKKKSIMLKTRCMYNYTCIDGTTLFHFRTRNVRSNFTMKYLQYAPIYTRTILVDRREEREK